MSGTPAARSTVTIDCARDRPRFTAADCASGSLDAESPYPMTEIVPLPRLAANAFTSSAAGGDRFDASLRNTIVAEAPADGVGIGFGAGAAGAGGGPATAGRAGGAAGTAGGGPAGDAAVGSAAGGLPARAVLAGGDAGGTDAVEAGAVELDGAELDGGSAASGALCTGLRGAADGAEAGALTAGIDALRAGVPDAAGEPGLAGDVGPGGVAPGDVAPGGGGGGAVPIPNRLGDAVGDDGSASGAASAACWALVRSATSESVNCFISSAFGGVGLAGTDAMFG